MLNNNFILNLFLDVLSVSAQSSVVILLVSAVSPLLGKRNTVNWRYFLWAVLAIRLALPFDVAVPESSFQIPISAVLVTRQDIAGVEREEGTLWRADKGKEEISVLGIQEREGELVHAGQEQKKEALPDRQGAEQQGLANRIDDQDQGLAISHTQDSLSLKESQTSIEKLSRASWNMILQAGAWLWAAGACLILVWQAVCYGCYCRKLQKQKVFLIKKGELPVFLCQGIASPMLMGIWKPQIMLPAGEYSKEQLEFILEHEYTHYKRKDLWMKLLLNLAKAIHWFNPIVSWMVGKAAQDIELLCDSQVVKSFTKEQKKEYSQTLLAWAASKKAGSVLCASEFSRDANDLKKRLENIFSEKRRKGILPALLGVLILGSLSFFVVFGGSEKRAVTDGRGMAFIAFGDSRPEIKMDIARQQYDIIQQKTAEINSSDEDFREITGKKYLYEDEEGWEYYLEEDQNQESRLREVSTAHEPFLLTRYREQKREILDDLIFYESCMECPVIFAEGRIIYKAAQVPEIMGIKDPVLVSIAMDGSDRKIADTILYHVVDNVCEDGGWIYYSGWTNSNEFPKPLCRIAPDFSSEPQFVQELPGLLCGIKDGNVYYMAARGKKSGIWKQNLSTGEEVIYEKWGECAEEFVSFYAREWEFLAGELREEESTGCKILFQYDYEDEIKVANVAFE